MSYRVRLQRRHRVLSGQVTRGSPVASPHLRTTQYSTASATALFSSLRFASRVAVAHSQTYTVYVVHVYEGERDERRGEKESKEANTCAPLGSSSRVSRREQRTPAQQRATLERFSAERPRREARRRPLECRPQRRGEQHAAPTPRRLPAAVQYSTAYECVESARNVLSLSLSHITYIRHGMTHAIFLNVSELRRGAVGPPRASGPSARMCGGVWRSGPCGCRGRCRGGLGAGGRAAAPSRARNQSLAAFCSCSTVHYNATQHNSYSEVL